jgi:hypothetical protein
MITVAPFSLDTRSSARSAPASSRGPHPPHWRPKAPASDRGGRVGHPGAAAPWAWGAPSLPTADPRGGREELREFWPRRARSSRTCSCRWALSARSRAFSSRSCAFSSRRRPFSSARVSSRCRSSAHSSDARPFLSTRTVWVAYPWAVKLPPPDPLPRSGEAERLRLFVPNWTRISCVALQLSKDICNPSNACVPCPPHPRHFRRLCSQRGDPRGVVVGLSHSSNKSFSIRHGPLPWTPVSMHLRHQRIFNRHQGGRDQKRSFVGATIEVPTVCRDNHRATGRHGFQRRQRECLSPGRQYEAMALDI